MRDEFGNFAQKTHKALVWTYFGFEVYDKVVPLAGRELSPNPSILQLQLKLFILSCNFGVNTNVTMQFTIIFSILNIVHNLLNVLAVEMLKQYNSNQ